MSPRLAPLLFLAVGTATATYAAALIPNLSPYPNPSGFAQTYSTAGDIDTTNPFFQSLGSNGRACVTCHDPAAGFSITPPLIRKQFDDTLGNDPLFRPVDGANSPLAKVSTLQERLAAYSMLLNKGVIRIGLPIPRKAEFALVRVDDPYRFASARELSLFRRPLPATNLRFLSDVMWDGREVLRELSHRSRSLSATERRFLRDVMRDRRERVLKRSVSDPLVVLHLRASLLNQANNATRGHAQGAKGLTLKQAAAIVNFEMTLHTAQSSVTGVGNEDEEGAKGGPQLLASQNFFLGINDPLGHNPTGAPFDARAVTIFNAWRTSTNEQRQAVARGQDVFNTKPIRIEGVGGLNDELDRPVIVGTCSTCHSAPNVGSHSIRVPQDIGLTSASRRTLDMPLYTLRNRRTKALRQTTDPGRALITGKWKDIGRFKMPVLRGLSARAPYFHNGSAADLDAVVDFYEGRFNIGLTPQERADLLIFLKAL